MNIVSATVHQKAVVLSISSDHPDLLISVQESFGEPRRR